MEVYDKSLEQHDLSFLECLQEYSFESKMMTCQLYSAKIMKDFEVSMELANKENIYPWEIEVFATYSVLYHNPCSDKEITPEIFSQVITGIRNYIPSDLEYSSENTNFDEKFVLRFYEVQAKVQGDILEKMYRYNFFYNFTNQNFCMKNHFTNMFKAEYSEYELAGFASFLAFSLISIPQTQEKEKRPFLNTTLLPTTGGISLPPRTTYLSYSHKLGERSVTAARSQ